MVRLVELLQCLLVELLQCLVRQMGRVVIRLLANCVLRRLLHRLVLLLKIWLLHYELRYRALVDILVLLQPVLLHF